MLNAKSSEDQVSPISRAHSTCNLTEQRAFLNCSVWHLLRRYTAQCLTCIRLPTFNLPRRAYHCTFQTTTIRSHTRMPTSFPRHLPRITTRHLHLSPIRYTMTFPAINEGVQRPLCPNTLLSQMLPQASRFANDVGRRGHLDHIPVCAFLPHKRPCRHTRTTSLPPHIPRRPQHTAGVARPALENRWLSTRSC